MEAIIFCGIQATGKTSFYKDRFFKTHVKISLDQLKTRNRENKFLRVCLETKQPFVVDNTNPSIADRAKYITIAKKSNFRVIGFYFQSKLSEAIKRNGLRLGKEKIPEVGIRATSNKLQVPTLEEGFDELYYVEIRNDIFITKEWADEVR